MVAKWLLFLILQILDVFILWVAALKRGVCGLSPFLGLVTKMVCRLSHRWFFVLVACEGPNKVDGVLVYQSGTRA
jgi:hypothetical protein